MDSTNTSEGHAPFDGRYLCTAEAGPGQLTLWINGEVAVETANPGGAVGLSTERQLSRLDSIRFEANPGPLYSHDVEILERY